MELSQPRPCGAQGAKPTHDFLSLYSPAQQDGIPNIAGGYLRTHNFLQPLEQVGKNVAKEGNKVDCDEKSFPPAPPTMVDHILPWEMGTCSVSHISYINQSQKVPKPEGIVTLAAQSSSSNNHDENSNCSSYTGSGFTLWEESNVKKGKTRKENIAENRHMMRDGGIKIGVPWMTSMERPSQSSSIHNHPSTTFSSLSSSHPPSASKNQYIFDTVKSAKSVQEEEYNDEEFVIKRETSFHHKGIVSVKADQKPNSPRSKHSATEQRRRSKINDRFSTLRGIIPHGDQKRDKASFLLEVIEYIQFLQEKVHKYEDSEQGWNNEAPNMIPLKKGATQVPKSGPEIELRNKASADDEEEEEEEVMIESGRISISTIYSQGLCSGLTQALRRSGVDLSEANISVQIDLGKRRSNTTYQSQGNGTPSVEESGEALKRLKRSSIK